MSITAIIAIAILYVIGAEGMGLGVYIALKQTGRSAKKNFMIASIYGILWPISMEVAITGKTVEYIKNKKD